MTATKYDVGKPPAFYNYWDGIYHIVRDENKLFVKRMRNITQAGSEEELIDALWKLFDFMNINILDISRVCYYGARKYGMNNYKGGMEWSRLLNAMGRHACKYYLLNESKDDESKIDHRYHAGANVIMLIEYIRADLGVNDVFNWDSDTGEVYTHRD